MAVILCVSVGCSAPPLATGVHLSPLPPSSLEQRLGPNDVIEVIVYGHPELSTPVTGSLRGTRIGPEGSIQMPLVGSIHLAGQTLAGARASIVKALSDFYTDPSAAVSVIQWGSRQFHLMGEVVQSGAHVMDRPLTALEALSYGKGFQDGADRVHVALIRTTGAEAQVALFNAQSPGPAAFQSVAPGDILFVRQAGVGRFSEEIQPYLQAFGMTAGQISTALLALDRITD